MSRWFSNFNLEFQAVEYEPCCFEVFAYIRRGRLQSQVLLKIISKFLLISFFDI